MDLDLSRLGDMHPVLSQTLVRDHAYKAAIGVELHAHASGVSIVIKVDGIEQAGKADAALQHAACVVEFKLPRARLATV